MKFAALILALVFTAIGCASAADGVSHADMTPDLGIDAGGDVLAPPTPTTTGTVPPPPPPVNDGGAPDAVGVDAVTVDTAPAIDAGSAPDAATAPDAMAIPDAAATSDATDAQPAIDVRIDTAPTADARADSVADAGALCPDPSNPKCAAVLAGDERIRATFTKPCAPELARKCGGVPGPDVVETLPMVCRDAQWRIAGSWNGYQWLTTHECSTGCASGKICDP